MNKLEEVKQPIELSAKDQAKRKAIDKAKIYTSCNATSAFTIDLLHEESLDIETLIDKMRDSVRQVNQGDLQEIEAMLMTQANTLNVLFHRSLSQVGNSEFLPQAQTFSDIALRAQNQCRKTLAALVEIKHPRRSTFIKQQNNAVNQQVNNEIQNENQKISANELLEINNEQRLDTRATFTSISANTQVEAVEVGRG